MDEDRKNKLELNGVDTHNDRTSDTMNTIGPNNLPKIISSTRFLPGRESNIVRDLIPEPREKQNPRPYHNLNSVRLHNVAQIHREPARPHVPDRPLHRHPRPEIGNGHGRVVHVGDGIMFPTDYGIIGVGVGRMEEGLDLVWSVAECAEEENVVRGFGVVD